MQFYKGGNNHGIPTSWKTIRLEKLMMYMWNMQHKHYLLNAWCKNLPEKKLMVLIFLVFLFFFSIVFRKNCTALNQCTVITLETESYKSYLDTLIWIYWSNKEQLVQKNKSRIRKYCRNISAHCPSVVNIYTKLTSVLAFTIYDALFHATTTSK